LAAHQALADEVKASADVVWPLTHSAWGEQGHLHAVLEAAGVQFVGTPPAKAADATDKLRCAIDAVVLAAALETESSTCTTWQVSAKADFVKRCDSAAGWQSGCRTWGTL
jgi:D-alanine-D-alanine ligase-like ATP-grasp enzyme